jgi:hypothetical protein
MQHVAKRNPPSTTGGGSRRRRLTRPTCCGALVGAPCAAVAPAGPTVAKRTTRSWRPSRPRLLQRVAAHVRRSGDAAAPLITIHMGSGRVATSPATKFLSHAGVSLLSIACLMNSRRKGGPSNRAAALLGLARRLIGPSRCSPSTSGGALRHRCATGTHRERFGFVATSSSLL